MSDAIEAHVTSLAATLRGPARAKGRLVREARDGLTDATALLVEEGIPSEEAARLAVRDFGAVEEVAPSFQEELTVAQARHTARTVALVVPALIACWTLAGGTRPGESFGLVEVLALYAGAVAGVAALLAAGALAATGAFARLLPAPERLPLLVAWTGTAAGAALGVGALTLTFSSAMAANWLLAALLGAVTLASHARVAATARACRECARQS